jgi:hypothetical protein
MREDGFSLIVGSVSHGDFIQIMLSDELFEEGIASTTCGILKVGMFPPGFRRDILPEYEKGQIVLSRKLGHEFLVGARGFAAQLVIEVHNRKHDARECAGLKEQTQQRHRVCASRNGYPNTQAGAVPFVLMQLA